MPGATLASLDLATPVWPFACLWAQSCLPLLSSSPLVYSSPSPCSTDFFHAHAHAHHALAPACGLKQARTCSRTHARTHRRTHTNASPQPHARTCTCTRNTDTETRHRHCKDCKKRPVWVPFSSTTTRTVTSCKHRSTQSARFHTDPTHRQHRPTHASLDGLAPALGAAVSDTSRRFSCNAPRNVRCRRHVRNVPTATHVTQGAAAAWTSSMTSRPRCGRCGDVPHDLTSPLRGRPP
jgi:hypothetical protein